VPTAASAFHLEQVVIANPRPFAYLHICLFEEDTVDRKKKIHQIANLSGRVSKISNLLVQPKYIHPEYRVEACAGILSETGQLEVLKVVPNSGSGPYFTARWDQKPAHVDFDMHEASSTAIKNFKANTGGYSGHHNNRSSNPEKRIFDVTIKTPAGLIFDGAVSFFCTYEVNCRMQATATMTADATVVRAVPNHR
jgi:hypothetical protein